MNDIVYSRFSVNGGYFLFCKIVFELDSWSLNFGFDILDIISGI